MKILEILLRALSLISLILFCLFRRTLVFCRKAALALINYGQLLAGILISSRLILGHRQDSWVSDLTHLLSADAPPANGLRALSLISLRLNLYWQDAARGVPLGVENISQNIWSCKKMFVYLQYRKKNNNIVKHTKSESYGIQNYQGMA